MKKLLILFVLFAIFTENLFAADVVANWVAPTQREDNSILDISEIGGFRIYYGNSTGNYVNQVDINDGTLTTFTMTGLPEGNMYFVMTTIDTEGRESTYSNEVFTKIGLSPPKDPQNIKIINVLNSLLKKDEKLTYHFIDRNYYKTLAAIQDNVGNYWDSSDEEVFEDIYSAYTESITIETFTFN